MSFLVSLLQCAATARRVELVHNFDDGHFAEVVVGQIEGLDGLVVVEELLHEALLSELQLLLHCAVHQPIRRQSTSFQVQSLQFEAF